MSGLFHPGTPFSTDPNHVRTLLVTGDVIPARLVNVYATQKNDFLWPFRPTADYVKNADITFANLETPLFSGCKLTPTNRPRSPARLGFSLTVRAAASNGASG